MKCAECGQPATKMTKEGLPLCSQHANAKVKKPKCPNCGLEMAIRKGKYGSFWGCVAFPMCDGLRKI